MMSDYSKIKYIAMDVDGTMTDGGLIYDAKGNELKRFDVKDGLAVLMAIQAGYVFLVITGRVSAIVERRVKELGIQHFITGAQLKFPAFRKWLEEQKVSLEEVCYIGDDWNDLECMKAAGASMCPADAAPEVKEVSDYVADAKAGYGAVRECLEVVMKSAGVWEKTCERVYFE